MLVYSYHYTNIIKVPWHPLGHDVSQPYWGDVLVSPQPLYQNLWLKHSKIYIFEKEWVLVTFYSY